MDELLKRYQLLNEEQKNKIFTKEQRKVIDTELFIKKIFNDPYLYDLVEETIGEAVYEELTK